LKTDKETQMDRIYKALKNVGIDIKNTDGAYRDLSVDILDELCDKWKEV